MRKVEFYWRFRIVGRVFDKLGMRKKTVSCFILFLKLHSSVFLDLQKKKDLQYMLYEGGFLFLCHIYYSSLLWTYLLHGYFHGKKKKNVFLVQMKADNFSTFLPSTGFPFGVTLGIAVTETVLATWRLSKAKNNCRNFDLESLISALWEGRVKVPGSINKWIGFVSGETDSDPTECPSMYSRFNAVSVTFHSTVTWGSWQQKTKLLLFLFWLHDGRHSS